MYEYNVEEIKHWRKKLNLTQHQLADISGVSQSLIAKVESGILDPTYSKAKKIFQTLESLEIKTQKTVKDILQKKILFVTPEDSIKQTISLMRKNEISQLPVIDNNTVTGLISETNILDAIIESKNYDTKIKEIMIEPPPTISENSSVDIASHLLKHFPLVIVAKKGKPIGILTKADILNQAYN